MVSRCFYIDTSTGILTPLESEFEFSSDGRYNNVSIVSDNHYVNFFYDTSAGCGCMRIFNLSGAFAVTASDLKEITNSFYGLSCKVYDDNKIIATYSTTTNIGYARTYLVSEIDYTISDLGDLVLHTPGYCKNAVIENLSEQKKVISYTGIGSDGFLRALNVEIPSEETTTITQII
jgi:hypothetical protein